MMQPFQQNDKQVLLGAVRNNRGGNGTEVFEQVISRYRETYRWARQNRFSMECHCLIHLVLHNLQALEGLEFLEEQERGDERSTSNDKDGMNQGRSRGIGQGETWVPATELHIRQAVIASLEQGLPPTGTCSIKLSASTRSITSYGQLA